MYEAASNKINLLLSFTFVLDDILIQLGGSKAESQLNRKESLDSFTQLAIPDSSDEVNLSFNHF